MSFKPRRNLILAALAEKRVPLGMQVSITDPSVIEILASTGFDFYMLCMEHTRIDGTQMEHCIRAADAAGITTLVRVAENNSTMIRQALEAGAQGIVIPHIQSGRETRRAVDAVRYPPEGKRGMCPAIRAANYSIESWDEYLDYSRTQTMVIPLIEGREGVEHADEILAELKPGVDAVGVGRGDLAQDISKPGEKVDFFHPFLAEAHKRVLTLAGRLGIPLMDMAWPNYNVEDAKRLINMGVKIMLYHVDQFEFYRRCQQIVREFKKTAD
jgi:2-keto-3-deoxy-L-rhamnonate aldolase RhmA